MRKGNLTAAGSAIVLALATLGLLGCGSGGTDSTSTAPALSAAAAGRLAKLSDQVASDLDAGETCTAAHAADDLQAAIQDADLPDSIRPGVDQAATSLVDQVNCPPPPPPVEQKPPEEQKPKPEKHGKPKDHGGDHSKPSGHTDHGGLVPPGHAKLKGEPG